MEQVGNGGFELVYGVGRCAGFFLALVQLEVLLISFLGYLREELLELLQLRLILGKLLLAVSLLGLPQQLHVFELDLDLGLLEAEVLFELVGPDLVVDELLLQILFRRLSRLQLLLEARSLRSEDFDLGARGLLVAVGDAELLVELLSFKLDLVKSFLELLVLGL